MQRCPKCGYRQRLDWLGIVPRVSVCILFLLVMFIGNYAPGGYRMLVVVIGGLAFLLFVFAVWWKEHRDRMEEIDNERRQQLQKLN